MQASDPGIHRVIWYPLRNRQVVRVAFLVEVAESWAVEIADIPTQSLLSVIRRQSRQTCGFHFSGTRTESIPYFPQLKTDYRVKFKDIARPLSAIDIEAFYQRDLPQFARAYIVRDRHALISNSMLTTNQSCSSKRHTFICCRIPHQSMRAVSVSTVSLKVMIYSCRSQQWR